MYYIAEDPWPLAGALGLVALGFLIGLRMTQEGKYLVRAGIALGLALVVIVVERVWVTDNERIEAVVYDVAAAVAAGDVDGVAKHMAPEAELTMPDNTYEHNPFMKAALGVLGRLQGMKLTPEFLRDNLKKYRFDFVRVGKLEAHAGEQSRRGTADFRIHAFGEQLEPFAAISTPPAGMGWSFGLREESPKVWKITRVTPTSSLSELQQSGPSATMPGR